MVFGRVERIEIPDTDLELKGSAALKLREVLPDWSPQQVSKFLTRPVFEPASLGQLRLHNDNQGVVRGFLAARWLRSRLEANAPRSRVFALLFGSTDERPIVLPSAGETAAWLSTWNDNAAREVVQRDPSLLLTAGDPSSLSSVTRQTALEAVIGERASGATRHELLDPDTLRRFATPDILPTLEKCWSTHRQSKNARRLILSMIELGRISGALEIARSAVDGTYSDRTTMVFGIRALGAICEPQDLEALATRAEADGLDNSVLWEALEVLFPRHLSVEAFLDLIRSLSARSEKSDRYDWRGTPLVGRLRRRDDFRILLQGLLNMIRTERSAGHSSENTPDNKLLPLVQAAATGLLSRLPSEAIDPLIIEAAVRLSADRTRALGDEDKSFQQLLRASPERRRRGLWHAVDLLKNYPDLQAHGLSHLWQLEFVGWSAVIGLEDVPWLLEDTKNGDSPLKRRLALGALMLLWRDNGKSDQLLADIRQTANLDAELKAFVDDWLAPRKSVPGRGGTRPQDGRIEEAKRGGSAGARSILVRVHRKAEG